MRKAGFFLIGIVFSVWSVLEDGVYASAFSVEPPPVLQVSGAPDGQPSNTVQGSVDEVGRGFVIVDGKRFQVAVDVRVIDEEDGVLQRGLNALRRQMKVELTLAGQTVVRIRVFRLLMR